MKIGFVIHRYGSGFSGGAEAHCRMVAHRVKGIFPEAQVEVITTTADDYLTWANAHEKGIEDDAGVLVRRFDSARERNLRIFDFLNRATRVFNGHAPSMLEKAWLTAQGPHSPKLLEYLEENAEGYDRLIFYTYLYEPTVLGLPLVTARGQTNTRLVTTAHDEPPLKLKIMRPAIESAGGLGFLSPAEARLVNSRFDVRDIPQTIIAAGVESPERVDPGLTAGKFGIEGPYILYLGRVDIQKGIPELLSCWATAQHKDLKLVLAGEPKMRLPDRPDLITTGYISDQEKWSGLSGALAVVAPSPYESLNLTVLEAGVVGRPVLVNGACEVLKDYVERSGGGYHYTSAEEFGLALEKLREPGRADELGRANKAHTEIEYSWEAFDNRLITWLNLE